MQSKKPTKYDDDAFKRDLEKARNPYSGGEGYADEIDVKQIIRSALQVEDESRHIKHKNGYKVGDHKLYQVPQPSKPLKNNLVEKKPMAKITGKEGQQMQKV